MHIYLVRHTKYHNPDNIFPFHLPVNLSVDGREHAQRVAQWFAEQELLNLPIFSSPIVRCVQTAEIIAAQTNSYVACDDRLIETFSPGIQGQPMSGQDDWKIENEDPTRESQESVRQRAVSIFEEKSTQQQSCILVSHGDPLTILYYHLLDEEPPADMWMPENEELVINRGEIVDVEIDENGPMKVTRYKV